MLCLLSPFTVSYVLRLPKLDELRDADLTLSPLESEELSKRWNRVSKQDKQGLHDLDCVRMFAY